MRLAQRSEERPGLANMTFTGFFLSKKKMSLGCKKKNKEKELEGAVTWAMVGEAGSVTGVW